MLSSDLRWSHHMNKIILEGSKRAGLLRLMARDLPSSVIIKLYLYYLRPSLEYASPCWHGSISSSHAMALERIQASVARCVLRASWMNANRHCLLNLIGPHSVGDVTLQLLRSYTVYYKTAGSLL